MLRYKIAEEANDWLTYYLVGGLGYKRNYINYYSDDEYWYPSNAPLFDRWIALRVAVGATFVIYETWSGKIILNTEVGLFGGSLCQVGLGYSF